MGVHAYRTETGITVIKWIKSVYRKKFSFLVNALQSISAKPEKVALNVNFKDYLKLREVRKKALDAGVFNFENEKFVPAIFSHEEKSMPARIRLKGGQIDHVFQKEAWSFKVRLDGEDQFNGMKRFNLQHPQRRGYMNEWVFQKLCAEEGLINFRYGFLRFSINNRVQPIYSYEETIGYEALENNNRAKGVLFRFESNFLSFYSDRGIQTGVYSLPVDPYYETQILNDSEMKKLFANLRKKIESWKNMSLKTSQIFDSPKLAMLFALTDLLGHEHGRTLSNLQFYDNPQSGLIEPVPFDQEAIEKLTWKGGVVGLGRIVRFDESESYAAPESWNDIHFSDPVFFRDYMYALAKISDEAYLDNFFNRVKEEYEYQLAILYKSYPWYFFSKKEILYENQKYIRELLSAGKCINAYYEGYSAEKNSVIISVKNIYGFPVEIVGLSVASGEKIILEKSIWIQAARKSSPNIHVQVEFILNDQRRIGEVTEKTLIVHYRIIGANSELNESVMPWGYGG